MEAENPGGTRGRDGVVDHPRPFAVLTACWLALGVRAVLVLGLLAIPLVLVSQALGEYIYVGVLGAFVITMGVYMILAAGLRCPACGRRFLVERHGQRHPDARRVPPFSLWGTVISDVIRRREFTCMYCSVRCRVHTDVK